MNKLHRAAQYYMWQEVKGMIDRDINTGDMERAFVAGAEWADAHPKEIDGCDFCKQKRIATHRSKECDLSYDGETLCVDIDMPLTWGSATGYYGFDVNYCPFCGRKLK